MAAFILPMLEYSTVNNLCNFQPILIEFVSKFLVCKALHFETQYALRLRSPFIYKLQGLCSHFRYTFSKKKQKKKKKKKKTVLQSNDKDTVSCI